MPREYSEPSDLMALRHECEACVARLARHEAEITAYWTQAEDLDPPLRATWTADARSAHAVAASLCVALGDAGAEHDGVDLQVHLDDLRGRVAVVVSELRSRRDPLGCALLAAWERDGRGCVDAFVRWAEALGSLRDLALSSAEQRLVAGLPVLRTGEGRYALFCAVCGKAAVTFELGEQLPGSETSLLCKGNIWQQSFSRALADTMFALLDEGRVRDVHACLIETGECREGVDAYCPDCDRVYCRLHYDCVDEYDEGFYDCTYGTCPAGHRRRVAD